MAKRKLDRWLARYRDTRDPEALGKLFDATSAELLRVARHLTGDAAEAEDLVQATFLALLDHPERYDGTGSAQAWMVGILTKEALAFRRRASRRLDERELGAAQQAREEALDPRLAICAAEQAGLLRAALARVPALYRGVLESHFLAGEPPGSIAARTGKAPATVRVQLHRGLEHLRRSLPAGVSASLVLGLAERGNAARGLAAVRADVLAQAAACTVMPAAGGASAAGASGLLGALVMSKKIALVAAAVLLAPTLWLLWDSSASRPAIGPGDGETVVLAAPGGAAPSSSHSTGALPLAPGRASVAPPTEEPSKEPPLPGRLRIATVFDDGTRAPHIGLRYVRLLPGAPQHETRTDATGAVLLEGLEPGQYVLYGDRGGHELAQVLEVRVAAGASASPELLEQLTPMAVLKLPAGRDVRGRVVDSAGRAVAGAEIWISTGMARASGTVAATSAEDGSFLLRQLGGECFLGARADAQAPSQPLHVEHEAARARSRGDAEDAPLEVLLELPGAAARVTGTLRDPAGRPVAGARVRVGAQDFFDTLGPGGVEGPPPPVEVRSDEGGRFEARGIAPGRVEVACLAEGFPVVAGLLELEPGASGALELRLEAPAWVRGRADDGAGNALAQITVRATERRFRLPHAGSSFDAPSAVTDDSGRFSLGPLGSGAVDLHARSNDGKSAAHAQRDVSAGGLYGWDFALEASPVLAGVAVDERGAPLAGWTVVAGPTSPGGPPPRAGVTSAQGLFELRFPKVGTVGLELHAPRKDGRGVGAPRAWLESVEVGTRDLRLVADPRQRPTAVLRAELDAASGAPKTAVATVRHPQFGLVAQLEVPMGPFELTELPAGELELRIEAPGLAPLHRREIRIAQGEHVDLGLLTLAPGATLVLDIADREPGPRPLVFVTLRDGEGALLDDTIQGSRWTSPALPAGNYRVFVHAVDRADVAFDLTLRAGESLERKLALVRGAPLGLSFVDTAGAPLASRVHVRITDGAGQVVDMRSLAIPPTGPATCSLSAPFGPLRLEAHSDDGRRATWEVDFRGQFRDDRWQPIALQ